MERENEKLRTGAQARMRQAGMKRIGQVLPLDGIPARTGGKLCLGMECLDRALWELEPALAPLSCLGVQQARLQTGWARTETKRGIYDFSTLDGEVDSLLAIGIQPWLSLSYGNPLYYAGDVSALRAGGIGHVPLDTEEARTAWQRYTAETVRRYRGRVHRYEIWNEPDVAIFFPTTAWTQDYMDLVRLTAPVIRAQDPTAEIVACTGGVNGFAPLLEMGLAAWVDAYSFHQYMALPELQDAAFRASLQARRDAYKPGMKLIRGEAGCPSYNAPTSRGALHTMKTSETVQAKWMGRHLIPDLADPGLAMTSYFHAYEFLHFSRQHHYYYGILRTDYSRKPSFELFQLLCHVFDGDTREAPRRCLALRATEGNAALAEADLLRVRAYAFERRGIPLFAYWNAGALDAPSDVAFACAECLPACDWHAPVLVDPFSQEVYAVSLEANGRSIRVPVTDYPLLLTDARALDGLLGGDMAAAAGHAQGAQTAQYDEE